MLKITKMVAGRFPEPLQEQGLFYVVDAPITLAKKSSF
jgi:hypothetical protein